ARPEWPRSASGLPRGGPRQRTGPHHLLANRVRRQPRCGKKYRLPETSLADLALSVGTRAKRRDVDKRCNSRVDTGRGDDRATIGMTDQDRGAADTPQSSLHAIYIAGV